MRRKKQESESAAARRARRVPTHDLIPWAEAIQAEVGRSLIEWQRSGAPEAAEDAHTAALTLAAVTAEVRRRTET